VIRALALALLVSGCYATTGEPAVAFDRCNTGRVIDGCDVSDLPPLVAMLPPWPFPSLRVPIPEPPPPPEKASTPGSRFLQRLTK